jgi:hypothetical protein
MFYCAKERAAALSGKNVVINLLNMVINVVITKTSGRQLIFQSKYTRMVSTLALHKFGAMMKKILLIILFLLITFEFSYSDNQPLKIDISTQSTKIKRWKSVEVSAHILNISNDSQYIGTEGCGQRGVNSWISDNPSVSVYGSGSCRANIVPPHKVSLKPGETYDQTCRVSFDKKGTLGPLTFRIGLQNPGHNPAWSNSITLDVQ